ncbi:MAG: 5'-3' exonuclease H3TH domain-containing protein, partial [Actinomycetota bacterium]|nr:5'-3' exonuclease H3TH domain-containing protein [Actinomycetota bacterium]
MADPGRLLVLDGHSLAYRAFYALPVENFSTSTGQPTNAVYGFTSMLVNLLRDEEPSHVAVAFDVSRRSFRTEKFPDYKATRSASPEGFKGQVELIKEVVRAFGVNALELEGFEADDIIATLATQATTRGFTVGIVSGDRDTFQLVDERTTVLYPRKGVSDLARMTPEAIVEKYGLNPGQYADFAALRGDPSDNLPGIPGVGEKTAVKWLNAYSDLAGLIDHVDEVGGKVGDGLREAVPQVLVNRELTELVRDVPVAVDLDTLQWREWSRPSVSELFDSLQFAALRSRVESLPHGTGGDDVLDTRGTDEQAAIDIEVREAGAVAEVLAGVSSGAVAFRGSWAAGRGSIDAVAVCDGTSVTVLPLGGDGDRDALDAWLMDPAIDKRIHDAKGPDLAVLTRTGGDAVIRGVSVDTALAAYLDSPGARSYGLEDVATRLLGRTLDDEPESGQLALDGGGEEDLRGLGTQAQAVHDIAEVVQERLNDEKIDSLLAEMEIPLAGLLARMEYAGIAVDRA